MRPSLNPWLSTLTADQGGSRGMVMDCIGPVLNNGAADKDVSPYQF